MRYSLEIGKRRNEFISFIIAKYYFTFLFLQMSITRNIRNVNGKKATVKVSLPFAICHMLCKPCLVSLSFSKVLSEG